MESSLEIEAATTSTTSTTSTACLVRLGTTEDLDWLKALADMHKNELGFVRRGALAGSISEGHLLVAWLGGERVGFVQFHHRRDGQTTIYNVITSPQARGRGVGRMLLDRLRRLCTQHGQHSIALKCPVDLMANDFYAHEGYSLIRRDDGKVRELNVWCFELSG